jgi:hypothetical protein
MMFSRFLCAASVAVPALLGHAAMSQQIFTDPSGSIVVILPGPSGSAVTPVIQAASPASGDRTAVEQLVAQQDAIMARMMADMDAMFAPMSDPFAGVNGMLARVMSGSGLNGGNGMVCQESISVSYDGSGAKPLVKVSRSGNGCGEMSPTPAGTVPEAPNWTAPVPSAPRAAPPGVLEVKSPESLVPPGIRHRT